MLSDANPTEHSKERGLTIRQYEPVEIAAVFFLPFSFAVSEIMLIFAIGNHKGRIYEHRVDETADS